MNPFEINSPVQNLVFPILKQKNIHVDIKRDDMIHPFISGNKWRKLKHILIKAESENRNHIVTFGGAWSNHILATACLAANLGLKSTAYIRGEQVENPILQLCEVFGMTLHFTEREKYKNKKLLFNEFHKNDPNAFFVDEGGFSIEAAKGCEEIIENLPHQYDHIICACGTGATLAGIAKGALVYQPKAVVHGVSVLKGGDFILDAVESLNPNLTNIKLHTDYHFGGYAKTKAPLIEFIKGFCSNTGLLIEPVYTGKVFYALMDLIEKDYFVSEEKILIIHTGGLTGFLGNYKLFTKNH
jgi:1-aminocyclopropane-1-carboxylate deaminase